MNHRLLSVLGLAVMISFAAPAFADCGKKECPKASGCKEAKAECKAKKEKCDKTKCEAKKEAEAKPAAEDKPATTEGK